jgi:hypothetical protein
MEFEAMPLFYLRPFDFHADKKAKLRALRLPVIDIPLRDFVLFGAVGLVSLALFVGLVIVPALAVLGEMAR